MMGVKTWNLIKHSKNFYVKTYRATEKALLFSLFLNFCLAADLFYVYWLRPEPDYYATFGETAPVPLIAMNSPNYTSHPLLVDDTNQDSDVKEIPN